MKELANPGEPGPGRRAILGRDRAAPTTIRFWVTERTRLGLNVPGDGVDAPGRPGDRGGAEDQELAVESRVPQISPTRDSWILENQKSKSRFQKFE